MVGSPDLRITEIQPLPKVEQKYRDKRRACDHVASSDERKSNPTLWGLLPGKIPVWRQDVTRAATVNKGAEDPGAEKEANFLFPK